MEVLQRIGTVQFLRDRLCIIGGTALNLVELPRIERLSVDLDFNFRQTSLFEEWKDERDEIDLHVKQVLQDQGYDLKRIKINPSYPLTRFDVKYTTQNKQQAFKIEIGYMRRIPLFPDDRLQLFVHPKTKTTGQILMPQKEELFGGKCGTLLGRTTTRDVFDVATIANCDFNQALLRKALILNNMMQGKQNFVNLNISAHVQRIRHDSTLKSVVRGETMPKDHFIRLRQTSIDFLEGVRSELTDEEQECLHLFFVNHEFRPDLLGSAELFHPHIDQHPAILWALKSLKNRIKPKKST